MCAIGVRGKNKKTSLVQLDRHIGRGLYVPLLLHRSWAAQKRRGSAEDYVGKSVAKLIKLEYMYLDLGLFTFLDLTGNGKNELRLSLVEVVNDLEFVPWFSVVQCLSELFLQ